jgi:hypothetical protein
MAAKVNFALDPCELLDRGPEFEATIRFLGNMLCPDGVWGEDKLDALLEELQNYSLIILVPVWYHHCYGRKYINGYLTRFIQWSP